MDSKEMKQELAKKAEKKETNAPALKTSMSIADLIRAMEPEIKRALPKIMTPERFTRMALSALNNTPKLMECSQMSFLTALMNAAQLGLEPNTPLGQAYLIPYNNRGKLECQFQIGYRGMIDLVYRSGNVQFIDAQAVYEKDQFDYELGLNANLYHKPTLGERGSIKAFYAIYKTVNGGFRFEVMGKSYMDSYAERYSKSYEKESSPWRQNYEAMAKKTCIKQLLKYAPMNAELQKAISMDESIKYDLAVDMSEVQNRNVEGVDINAV